MRLRCPNRNFLKELRRQVDEISENQSEFGAFCPASVEYDDGHVFGFRRIDDAKNQKFFEMGLVGGVWQLIRVKRESYFLKRGDSWDR